MVKLDKCDILLRAVDDFAVLHKI